MRSETRGNVEPSLILTLIILFGLFVICDYVTTAYLISIDPRGFQGEGNPIAKLLYETLGLGGMLAAKTAYFISFSTLIIALEHRWGHIGWFKSALEYVVLGLIGASILVIVNNVSAIIVLHAAMGKPIPSEEILKYAIPILAVTLTLTLGSLLGLRRAADLFNAAFATIIFVYPLSLGIQSLTLYLLYLSLVTPTVVAVVYALEKLLEK